MHFKPWMKYLTITSLLLILTVTPLLSACSSDTDVEEEPVVEEVVEEVEEADEFSIVKDAVAGYLAAPKGNVNASDLKLQIAEGTAPTIVSIRSAADYAKGHIPGATNLAFSDLTTLPKDDDIVVYCYTGQSASMATAVLGILDYSVMNLRHGMASWSDDPEVFVKRFTAETAQNDFAIETEANTGGNYDYPVLENTSSNDEDAIILAAAKTVSPKFISAADLNVKIAEGEDMTIVSIRKAEHYAIGHIPGAINLPYGTAITDGLDQIDPDAPVYVYCYTGHTAAQAVALLNMLGYDAYSISFGMCSWTSDPDVNLGYCFDPATSGGYETEK